MTTTDSTLSTAVETYLAMWNEPDAAARSRHIERAWAPDGHYVDPLLEARGHDALHAMVETVLAQYPGHEFRATSGIDAHHDEFRFGWELVGPDGAVVVAGIDTGTLTADGRIARITGFFGPLT